MAEHDPFWVRACSVCDVLDVAYQLAILNASDTPANSIATVRHLAALVDVARDSLTRLATDLEGMEAMRGAQEQIEDAPPEAGR